MTIQAIQEGNKLTRHSKRLGRGVGSGRGGKAARGQKGQGSRKSSSIMAVFEGGQTPFIQKMPKLKGFKRPQKVIFQVVNLFDLNQHFEDNAEVSPATLFEKGLIRSPKLPIKLLGTGKLEKKLLVALHTFSKSAKEAIEKAGGKLEELLKK